MNTAFVAAAGKLPESGTHSLACFTRGGCSGSERGGKEEEEEEEEVEESSLGKVVFW